MNKTLAALALALTAHTASAQEIEPVGIYNTQLYCYDPRDVFGVSSALQESPLFTGYASVDGISPQDEYLRFEGPMMFMVNQTSGTWIMGMISPTGEFCSIAVGADFEPYGG